MKVTCRTPIRIDLAGGTIDLWPLSVMVPGASTINLGIDIHAEATVENHDGEAHCFESIDQNTKADSSESLPPTLSIHQTLASFYFPGEEKRVKVTSTAKGPPGAGLGGSSALSVAMASAMRGFLDSNFQTTEEMGFQVISEVRDLESKLLGVPAGVQDYFGAYFGGLQHIQWLPGGVERRKLGENLEKELERRLLLFYSGQSRNSGINNWEVFKAYIDKDKTTVSSLNEIAEVTNELAPCIEKQDWARVSSLIDQEWLARKKLAPGISTPEIDEAIGEGLSAGGSAAKICGAGGGGCFFIFLEKDDPSLRKTVLESVISTKDVSELPFKACSGVELSRQ